MQREGPRHADPLRERTLKLPAGDAGSLVDDACGEEAEPRPAAAAEAPVREPARPAADPLAGRQMGPYRLIRRIGAGGMGEVYLARDTRLERSVAVKLLPPEWSRDAAVEERFALEARTASSLDHPNICTVHDVGTSEEGRFFLVMAYYEGETLQRKLARGPLPVDAAVELATQVARGLARAHEAGIVHRDVKPGNVMVTARGEVKLLDFGIAKIAGAAGLTRTGSVVGTPAYLAPEHANGDAVDAGADVWALGVMLYEMLAGRRPFPGEHPQALFHAILTRDPPPLARLRPEVPAELERIVFRALAKDPAERYANAGAMLRDLETGLATPPATGWTGAGRMPAGAPARTAAAGEETLVESALGERPVPVLRVLVSTVLAGGAELLDGTADGRGISLSARHDRATRDLAARFGGVEADKQGGFLHLFERAADAVGFALAYHQALARLSQEEGAELSAQVGLHLGEVVLRRNSPADVARGARPLEVEGPARPAVARLAALARGRQTLLSGAVFELARRAATAGGEAEGLSGAELRWLAHGTYVFAGSPEPLEVCEVGVEGFAPLAEPAGSPQARRQVAPGDELTLGWRPAPGQAIPRRPNWTLVERLGEGGFGEVWLARHKSGDRRVFKFCFEAARLRALKREVTLFRLLKEALGHRHDITGILDWNFEYAPYFLESEYTEGGDLTAWAAAQGGLAQVPLATRLELVAEVAEALAAAHSVGILHKDVKPGNVLVAADRDGRPRARLTDFGIGLLTEEAKLGIGGITVLGFTATASATESTSGGTLRYLAPELLEGKPATIQADIYSLGVMLYQIVVGDFSRALAPGWQRDVEDDLLAEDLAAFVDGRPERRPASALEVAQRLRSLEARRAARAAERRASEEAAAAQAAFARAQRRRKLATAVAAAALAVLAVVAVLALQTLRARQEADRRRQQAEKLVDFMLGDLRQGLETIGRLDLLRKVAGQAQEYLASPGEGADSPADLRRRGTSLVNTADVLYDGGDSARAIASYRAARQVFAGLAAREPASAELRLDLADSDLKLGLALQRAGDDAAARRHLDAALAAARGLVARSPEKAAPRLVAAGAALALGWGQVSRNQIAAARASFEGALALLEGHGPPPAPAATRYWQLLLWTRQEVGKLQERRRENQAALASYRGALAVAERLSRQDPANLNWRSLHASSLVILGAAQESWGDSSAALDSYRTALEIYRRLAAEDPTSVRWTMQRDSTLWAMGRVSLRSGDPAAALGYLSSARAGFAQIAGRDPRPPALQALVSLDHQLGDLRWRRGERELARQHYARARSILERQVRQHPGDPAWVSLLAFNHLLAGQALAEEGRSAAARGEWARTLQLLPAPGASSPNTVALRAWALLALGRVEEARPLVARLPTGPLVDPRFVELVRRNGLRWAERPARQADDS